MTAGLEPRRLLVLVVDRDDDLRRKTGISTPVIGFEENLKAAQALVLSDPEEADANAMFGALKTYRELAEKLGEENVEVATLAGEESEGIEADMKILRELDEVLRSFPAEAAVFVSDGVTDQLVLPVISSRIPVISVKRLVVRQSESVEQTWLILGRYLRLLFTEPRYARMFLGIPGLFMAIIGALYLINVASLPLLITAIGFLLFARGFNLDQRIMSAFRGFVQLFRMPAYKQLRAFAAVVSLILFLSGLYIGYVSSMNTIYTLYPNPPDPTLYTWWWLEKIPLIIGTFITGSVDMIAVAIIITIISNVIYYVFVRDGRFWGAIRSAVLTVWLWALFKRTGILLVSSILGPFEEAQINPLLIVAILGIITMALTIVVTRSLSKMYAKYFRKKR